MSSSMEVRCLAQRPPGSGSARGSALVPPGLADMLSHGVKRRRRAQTGTWHFFGCRRKSSFAWMSRRRSCRLGRLAHLLSSSSSVAVHTSRFICVPSTLPHSSLLLCCADSRISVTRRDPDYLGLIPNTKTFSPRWYKTREEEVNPLIILEELQPDNDF